MSQVEKRGLPTVVWTAKQFVEDAHWSAKTFGLAEIPIIEVPECFTNNTPERIGAMVDAQMAAVLKGLTRDPEEIARNHSRSRAITKTGCGLAFSSSTKTAGPITNVLLSSTSRGDGARRIERHVTDATRL